MNERKAYIDRMIFHFNRKAISDCLLKLISNQSDISQEFSIEDEITFKRDLIKKLIVSMLDNLNDDEVIYYTVKIIFFKIIFLESRKHY